MILLAVLLSIISSSRNEDAILVQFDQEVIVQVEFGKVPIVTTYADCIKYKLLLAEARNLSLADTQRMCNDLFIEQTKTWCKNMRDDPNVTNYIGHLLRGVHAGIDGNNKRTKRSIFSNNVYTRREVREPPYDTNWKAYDRAVRRLKQNYDVRHDMNTYDVIANLHTSDDVIPTAHDGPGFFAWHREYLRIMEIALGCPIPYWDTTPDEAMERPQESCVWSDKYFGNRYGLVTTGIMRNLPSPIPVIRNINADGWLISHKDVKMAMSKRNLHEFTEISPCKQRHRYRYSWECFHKGIHRWIDGTIGPSNTTTFDPIFYPIHAFVDKIFEQFRQKLISKGIDPEKSYPEKNIKHHGPHHKTVWIHTYPDIEHLTNQQCYGNKLAALTNYSQGPVCPDCYHSDDLYCDHKRNRCVSRKMSRKEKYVPTTIATKANDGRIKLVETLELDEPKRTKHIISKTGPLPFGYKFKIGPRDRRTRNDGIPEL